MCAVKHSNNRNRDCRAFKFISSCALIITFIFSMKLSRNWFTVKEKVLDGEKNFCSFKTHIIAVEKFEESLILLKNEKWDTRKFRKLSNRLTKSCVEWKMQTEERRKFRWKLNQFEIFLSLFVVRNEKSFLFSGFSASVRK